MSVPMIVGEGVMITEPGVTVNGEVPDSISVAVLVGTPGGVVPVGIAVNV
jgi:hypothetical protein